MTFNMQMATLSSLEILFNVIRCILVFYGVYYMVSTICFGAFKLPAFDPKSPFDFQTWIQLEKCCAFYTKREMANFISMEATFFISTFGYAIFIHSRMWDYALTTLVLHFELSCLVMLNFPLNWSWWVCIVSGALLMTCFGEMICYCRRHREQNKVSPQ
ncbi:transmembrane protein 244 [Lingula anatina]|uniref:Transmembrane protein 244 n=1 Tax=Lingula anatina TaxID=7574 RepID=A0A1S3JSZ3_LINAN|nr:transmembrane protein 244 [Lingula anatina]|eukprot:XP_013413246.1 transmembrane protein 244 [Lingula anatina]